ncbi:MAG: DUF2807 domain-containing protein [Desulfobacterales bacterium]|jgi:hypothetical protein
MKIKISLRSTLCILTGIFVTGCIVINGDGFETGRIYGSGTVISEERVVPVFDQIHLKGSGKVILTRAASHSVQIKTDDNIMPYIRTEVDNGRLVIFHERKYIRPTILTYYITAANLEGVSIAGSGDISGHDDFDADRFYADISGSGDLSLRLRTERLESNISGSGSIYLSGATNFYDATITGSGDVDAFELQAGKSSVVITGSGNCRVNASELLRAKITGSGDVLYKGHPKIRKSITGSGKVKHRD